MHRRTQGLSNNNRRRPNNNGLPVASGNAFAPRSRASRRRRRTNERLMKYLACLCLVSIVITLPVLKITATPATFAKYSTDETPSILIIGGSDGSGTRAFCQALEKLNVPLLYSDHQTLDMEASQLFQRTGWPGFVKYTLNQTRGSLQYSWDDLPEDAKDVLKLEVKKFYKHLLEVHKDWKYHHPPTTFAAANIEFAIKAPASMLVFPVLQKLLHDFTDLPVKFLHVVRDGRDVSLSDNQSPEQKFYNVTYPDDFEERISKWQGELYNVRAMQLWNDWNLQAWNNNQHSENYMLARSEDLVNSRWKTLQGLHSFVRSPISLEELCCESKQKPKDLGQSTKFLSIHDKFKLIQDLTAKTEHNERRLTEDSSESILTTWKTSAQTAEQAVHEAITESLLDHSNKLLDMRLENDEQRSKEVTALIEKGRELLITYPQEKTDISEMVRNLSHRAQRLVHNDLRMWKKSIKLQDQSKTEVSAREIAIGKSLLERATKLDDQDTLVGERGVRDEIIRVLNFLEGHKEPTVQVEQRYGKWQGLLQNRQLLSKHLHQEGSQGLKQFGYEPFREFTYPSLNFECTPKMLLTCPDDPAEHSGILDGLHFSSLRQQNNAREPQK